MNLIHAAGGQIPEALTRLLIVAMLMTAAPAALGDTDVVMFQNGDRLTGEMKSLSRGQLKFDSDATGVINIEWNKVAYIRVNQGIQVETGSGDRYFGHITISEKEFHVLVETAQGPVHLPSEKVIGMNPIDTGGFRDIDINVSVGYNFTAADSVTQFNVAMDADYRTQKRIFSTDFSSLISDSSNNDVNQRQSLSFNSTRLRPNRWLNDAGISFDRNDELGVNLRTSISAGGGRILVQTNRSNFILKGGLKATRENNIDEPEDVDSLESYGTMTWEWFRYDEPELDWSTTLEIIPSLTESGRVRGQFDATLRWEIINDFYWQLTLYDSYDNKPPADSTSNDYGITTALSYKF